MAEREEYEEHEEHEEEERPRRVRVLPYPLLSDAEAAVHARDLAAAERAEAEEQLADDIEQLAARRGAPWQSPYAAPGVPLSPQQAEDERALDDAVARGPVLTDDADEEPPLGPRRRAAVAGRVHGTWQRQMEQEEYSDWVHEQGLVPGAGAEALWRETQAEREREGAEATSPERAPDDDEQTPDDHEPGTSRRRRAGTRAGTRAGAVFGQRVSDDAEREEPRQERAEVAGWLPSGHAPGGWLSGLDDWVDRDAYKAWW